MGDAVVQGTHPVTLVGGGEVTREILNKCLSFAPGLVAADGGADSVLALGRTPDAVIGDMDSITPEGRARIPDDRLHQVTEQDSTDFEKCLSRIDAPLVLACGVTGARVDHTLAVLSVLVRHAHRRIVVVGAEDCIFAAPADLALDLAAGTRVSLFPMAPVTGRSTGLRWPIDGIDFAPDGAIGTSNAATGPVTLAFDGPGMLVVVPRGALDAALDGLSSSGR